MTDVKIIETPEGPKRVTVLPYIEPQEHEHTFSQHVRGEKHHLRPPVYGQHSWEPDLESADEG